MIIELNNNLRSSLSITLVDNIRHFTSYFLPHTWIGNFRILGQSVDFRHLRGTARPLSPRTGNLGEAGVDGDRHPPRPETVPQVVGVVRPRDPPARAGRRLRTLQRWLAADTRGATGHATLYKY